MPQCATSLSLHNYRPAAGPVTRLLVVLPLAQSSLPFEHPGAVKQSRLHATDDDSSVTCHGVIAVIYKTHWMGLAEPYWGREMDLQHSRNHILRYWTGTSDQHRQTNRFHRRMRIGAAQREFSRNKGEHFLAPSYVRVTRMGWICRFRYTVLPKGAHFWFGDDDGLWWWLGKPARAQLRAGYIWSDFWTTWGRLNFLSLRRATRFRRRSYEAFDISGLRRQRLPVGGPTCRR